MPTLDDQFTEVEPKPARVLVVDDDSAIRTLFERALREADFEVQVAADGAAAQQLFGREHFDVVVSDIRMPGLDGIELLRLLRERDLDVPVILVTGEPTLSTALRAIEYGALRYLAKPVDCDVLVETVQDAARMRRLAGLRRQLLIHAGDAVRQVADRAGLEVRFERALQKLVMVYQPIVDWPARRVFGYEALLRSKEPTMAQPDALLDAAERLDRLIDLGRIVRSRVNESIGDAPEDALLFVNLHARELLDDRLGAATAELSAHAARIVLEITEGARLEQIPDVAHRVGRLRQAGFRVAIDDIGAGYAGLSSFALLQPDLIKLDRGLVHELHLDATKRKLVASLVQLCTELGMTVVAEGVEKVAERDTLAEIGCRYMQGFLFAKPAVNFPQPIF